MSENLDAIKIMINSINNFIDGRLKKARFDVTEEGIITGILDGNKYRVQIHGTEYNVLCCTEQTFDIGNVVLVLCVKNNFNKKYIIGKGR